MTYDSFASLHEFAARFATVAACLSYIERARWPNGFVCPCCQNPGGYSLGGRAGYQCTSCGSQTSITAKSAFAYLKLALPKVFLGIYLMAANKQGISARSLCKHLDCSYPTALALLHKFRHAMQERNELYQLLGQIEVDEAYVGGMASGPGVRGRSLVTKTPVVAMVQKLGEDLTGYITLLPVRNVRSKTLTEAVSARISKEASIITDGLSSYNKLQEAGYKHLPQNSLGGRLAAIQFKLVHRQISNFKSWLLGAHRNTCREHLDLYAAEFTWRTNRRNRYYNGKPDERERTICPRLITALCTGEHWRWKGIIKQRWTQRKRRAA